MHPKKKDWGKHRSNISDHHNLKRMGVTHYITKKLNQQVLYLYHERITFLNIAL